MGTGSGSCGEVLSDPNPRHGTARVSSSLSCTLLALLGLTSRPSTGRVSGPGPSLLASPTRQHNHPHRCATILTTQPCCSQWTANCDTAQLLAGSCPSEPTRLRRGAPHVSLTTTLPRLVGWWEWAPQHPHDVLAKGWQPQRNSGRGGLTENTFNRSNRASVAAMFDSMVARTLLISTEIVLRPSVECGLGLPSPPLSHTAKLNEAQPPPVLRCRPLLSTPAPTSTHSASRLPSFLESPQSRSLLTVRF